MSRRARHLVAILALCVAASSALGVGSYGSVTADRGLSVAIVDNDDAYIGFADDLQCGMGHGVGDNGEFVRNQFVGETVIDRFVVRATAGGGEVRVGTGGPTHQLASGQSVTLTFVGPYRPGDGADIQVKPPHGNVSGADSLTVRVLDAVGANVSVSGPVRTFDVDCPDGGPSNATAGETGHEAVGTPRARGG
ncbi:hypothetical protein [Haloplanus pelagicus]|jgi:hypothetical protein|uniref:hypothetical protein n=1 Tax=Haloplanus pelagicus TaxID=2949995 RepID=UPI00203B06C3|nr:hypothetical protein [Haloplanus sp. HW8-1]